MNFKRKIVYALSFVTSFSIAQAMNYNIGQRNKAPELSWRSAEKTGNSLIDEATRALMRTFYLIKEEYCGPSKNFKLKADNPNGDQKNIEWIKGGNYNCKKGELDIDVLENAFYEHREKLIDELIEWEGQFLPIRKKSTVKVEPFAEAFDHELIAKDQFKIVANKAAYNSDFSSYDRTVKASGIYAKIVFKTIKDFVEDVIGSNVDKGGDPHTGVSIAKERIDYKTTSNTEKDNVDYTFGFTIARLASLDGKYPNYAIIEDVKAGSQAWRSGLRIGDRLNRAFIIGNDLSSSEIFGENSVMCSSENEEKLDEEILKINQPHKIKIGLEYTPISNANGKILSTGESSFVNLVLESVDEFELDKLPEYKTFIDANGVSGYLYLRINTFNNKGSYSTGNQRRAIGKRILEIFKQLEDNGNKIPNLVIDLRNNGGGSAFNAFLSLIPFSGQSIGEYLSTKFSDRSETEPEFYFDRAHKKVYRYGKLEQEVLDDFIPSHPWEGNIVILVNRYTASAAEYFPQIIDFMYDKKNINSKFAIIGEKTDGVGSSMILPYYIKLFGRDLFRVQITEGVSTVKIGEGIPRPTNDYVIPDILMKETFYNGDDLLIKALEVFKADSY